MMHSYLTKHIHDNIEIANPLLTYGEGRTGPRRLMSAISKFPTERLNPVCTVKPVDVSITNGCSIVIEHLSWGLSKDLGANGLRIGSVVSQSNPPIHDAFVTTGLYRSVSSVSDHIGANLLESKT